MGWLHGCTTAASVLLVPEVIAAHSSMQDRSGKQLRVKASCIAGVGRQSRRGQAGRGMQQGAGSQGSREGVLPNKNGWLSSAVGHFLATR